VAEQALLLKQRQSPTLPIQGTVSIPSSSSSSSLKNSYREANELLKKERDAYFRQMTLGNKHPHYLTRRLLEDKKMGVTLDPLDSSLLNMPNLGEHLFVD
jgi:hypothetical protein